MSTRASLVLMGSLAVLPLPSLAAPPGCPGSGQVDPPTYSTAFRPGALIIPMDFCYNPDTSGNGGPTNSAGSCVAGPVYPCYNNYSGGNVRLPFGLVYMLAANNIPVQIALNPTKLGMADADFSVTPPSGSVVATAAHLVQSGNTFVTDAGMTCGVNTVYYRGMPFIVEASYAAQALQVIAAFNNANADLFGVVPMHVVNYAFSAPIIGTTSTRPAPVVIDTSPLDTFFTESGIPAVVAGGTSSTYLTLNGAGNNFSFGWPSALLGANAGCPGDVCTSLTYTPAGGPTQNIVDTLWTDTGSENGWQAMNPFFQNGGTLLGVAAGTYWEAGTVGKLGAALTAGANGAQKGPYCAAVVTKGPAPLATPGPGAQYPASDRFLQLDNYDMFVHGGGGGDASTYNIGAVPTVGTHGLSNGTGYEVIAGHPTVAGATVPGNIVYLGSLNSWHGGSSGKDGGLHIMYNSLLHAQDCQLGQVELTRSSPVAGLVTDNTGKQAFRDYQGSFDWSVPANSKRLGNGLYRPDPSQYPYLTGHFREFKPTGTYTVNALTDFKNCSSASTSSACNWDAATLLRPFAARRIFVATGSFGAYTLTPAASLVAADPTIKYISTHLDQTVAGVTKGILGAIDWSTAAVIEAKPSGSVKVGSATSRPTLAYVGGNDGMIHAFCVQPEAGASACYGLASPGEELWAIIPPAVKARMDLAYNGGVNMDWSQVNVGGSMRVADIKDNFEPALRVAAGEASAPAAVYRTLLIVGTRTTGTVDALDISDPNPTRLNAAGFTMLWENDGTHSLVASQKMGGTSGATIVPTPSGGGAALVTASTCYGNAGCPTTTQPGINTYVLELNDGLVVSVDQKLYTRSQPTLSQRIINDVPALATTVDDDGAGNAAAFVADYEGIVRKFVVDVKASPPVINMAKSATVFDASSGGRCAGGVACQPIGASPSIVCRGSCNTTPPQLGVVVATGGADWARLPSARADYHALIFDASALTTTAEYFAASLGSTTPPASAAPGGGPGVQSAAYALRAYAQLTVAGTDLYADVTTVSVGSYDQLAQPSMTPGAYGNLVVWNSVNTTPTLSAPLLAAGSNFAGGAGSVLATNTSSSDGAIFAPDVSGPAATTVMALGGASTSLINPALAVNKPAAGTRPFSSVAWYDVGSF